MYELVGNLKHLGILNDYYILFDILYDCNVLFGVFFKLVNYILGTTCDILMTGRQIDK